MACVCSIAESMSPFKSALYSFSFSSYMVFIPLRLQYSVHRYMPVIDEPGDEFLNYVRNGMTVTVRDGGIVEVE